MSGRHREHQWSRRMRGREGGRERIQNESNRIMLHTYTNIPKGISPVCRKEAQ